MPLYVSICEQCGTRHEHYRPVAKYNVQPVCCGKVTKAVLSAPMVIPDIEPYRTVAADKETGKTLHISGRKQHKEFLKRNGYEELGTDPIRPTKHDDSAIERSTNDIIEEVRQKWRG